MPDQIQPPTEYSDESGVLLPVDSPTERATRCYRCARPTRPSGIIVSLSASAASWLSATLHTAAVNAATRGISTEDGER